MFHLIFLTIFLALSFSSLAQDSSVLRLHPDLDNIIEADAKVEKIAGGFIFTEGPVWIEDGDYLVFSDIPGNKIHKWDSATGQVTVYLDKSGFTGNDPTGVGRERNDGNGTYYFLGSNGATLDREGRLVFNAMGDRQIVRLEPDGSRTVLAGEYQGNRLNSTNDLVYRSDGILYFTDPPTALRGSDADPLKEMDYSGVFMLKDGELLLLTRRFERPNGITFSPDELYLYITDNRSREVARFDVNPDGTIVNGQVFIDMKDDPSIGAPDGIKTDKDGNLFVAGPGGIWVVSPEGNHLGKIIFPEAASNMTFGDADKKTLYVTARKGVYRIRLKVSGS